MFYPARENNGIEATFVFLRNFYDRIAHGYAQDDHVSTLGRSLWGEQGTSKQLEQNRVCMNNSRTVVGSPSLRFCVRNPLNLFIIIPLLAIMIDFFH
jgi:hypothetical protein